MSPTQGFVWNQKIVWKSLKEAPWEALQKGGHLLSPHEAQSLEVYRDPVYDVPHWFETYR